ncbi:MAG: TlpA disulfide reductase family protein [Saprospiraceae bacterium]
MVEGFIQNLNEGSIKLEKLDLISNERIDVAVTNMKDGHFTFSGTISKWGLHSIVINDSVRIPFFIESAAVKIKIPDFKSDTAIITGGINNELFTKHRFAFDKTSGIDLIYRYPNTTFAAFTTYYVIMNNNFRGDTINILIDKLQGEAKYSDYYSHIVNIAQSINKTSFGKIAPDFTVIDTLGKEMSLSNFKGKFVVLDFWTSWCTPCREANREWKEAYHNYSFQNIEFFSISFDVKCSLWKAALKKDNLPWPNGSNCNGWDHISDLYGVKSVPQTFLIHPDGRILDRNFGPEDFDRIFSSHNNMNN